jgi:hypothetical protein
MLNKTNTTCGQIFAPKMYITGVALNKIIAI